MITSISSNSVPQQAGTPQAQANPRTAGLDPWAIVERQRQGESPHEVARRLTGLRYRTAFGWCAIPGHFPQRTPQGVRCTCWLGGACDKPGKHPRGLWSEDTMPIAPDATVLAGEWLGETPNNVAILTGYRSRLVVADIDTHDGGNVSARLDALIAAGWRLDTCIAVSGGGGLHFYAAMPDGLNRVASIDTYLPGIEFKADGKLVIAPPSVHASGRLYTWAVGHDPDTLTPAQLPERVWDAILHSPAARQHRITATFDDVALTDTQRARLMHRAPKYVERAIQRATYNLDGGRNNTGRWLAKQLQSLRLPYAEAERYMLQYQSEVQHG